MQKGFLCLVFFLQISIPILYGQDQQQHNFNIYFRTNSDVVSLESMSNIRQQLLHIGTQNIYEIKLKGHADSDANDSFNIDLSNRRAKNCYKYLTSQGVPEAMLSMASFGESEPVSELKSLNRRVEISILYNYVITSNDLKAKKYVIKGLVSNYNTGRPISCTYVIEDQKLNIFQTTKSDGKFSFTTKPGRSISMTFAKENFLNSTINLDDHYLKKAIGDTLFIEAKLKPIEVIEKIVFEHIFFYTDSDSLKPNSKPDLDKLIGILKADKTFFVEIQGHMNCPISRPLTIYQKRYNHELSHKRAKTIYRYLIKNGIPANQLTFKGMSNLAMIYPEPKNEFEADKNKRVEVWKLKVIDK